MGGLAKAGGDARAVIVPALLTAEIERVLDAADLPGIAREYWAQNEFVFVRDFFPPSVIAPLLEDVSNLKDAIAYFGLRTVLHGGR